MKGDELVSATIALFNILVRETNALFITLVRATLGNCLNRIALLNHHRKVRAPQQSNFVEL